MTSGTAFGTASGKAFGATGPVELIAFLHSYDVAWKHCWYAGTKHMPAAHDPAVEAVRRSTC